MRLIDADNLKQEIRKGTTYYVRVWDTTGRDKWEMERDLSQKEIDEIIDNAPTIEAESIIHGRWYHIKAYKGADFGFFKCSVCGDAWWFTTKYCANCGAKMEGVEE